MALDIYGWSHLALCVVYFLMFLGSVWAGITTREGSKFEKVIFHGFFTAASICKIISFVLYIILMDKISEIDINGNLVYFLTTAPSFLFLSVYSIVLLKCLDVYQILNIHRAILINNRKQKLVVFGAITVVFYLILMGLFIIDFKKFPEGKANVNSPISEIQIVIQVIDASIYVLASIGFLFFWFYFYVKHYNDIQGKFTLQSDRQFFNKIVVMLLITFITFILRSPFVVVSIFLSLNVWYKDLLYYVLFECVPLSLLVYVWKLSVDYVALSQSNTIGDSPGIRVEPNYHTPLIRNNNNY